MAWLESLGLKVGSRVLNMLLSKYLGKDSFHEDLVEATGKGLEEYWDRREVRRQFEKISERIVREVAPIFEKEAISGSCNIEAVILEVAACLDGNVSAQFLLNHDLSPSELRKDLDRFRKSRDFSTSEELLISLALDRISLYLVEVSGRLQGFDQLHVAESLRRLSRLSEDVEGIVKNIRKLEERVIAKEEGKSERFEIRYRLAVANKYDYMELFGADLSISSRRYSLSVAYMSLYLAAVSSVSEDGFGSFPVDEVLDGLRLGAGRILIRGEAGSGKSTLFRWISIQSALGSSENAPILSINGRHRYDVLGSWRQRVPFLVRLRDCRGGRLPSPDDLPGLIASEVGRAPESWVRWILNSNRGIILLDGVDEIANLHRDVAKYELKALIDSYPGNYYLVSSRPEAIPDSWLEDLGFREATINPLSTVERDAFIDKWHEAIGGHLEKWGPSLEDLQQLSYDLKIQLSSNPPIARLATNPLLCAMICALHRDRGHHLPESHSELCEALCQMLLHRRDRESGLIAGEFSPSYGALTYSQKRVIVQELAHYLLLNSESAFSFDLATERVEDVLRHFTGHSSDDAAEVCKALVERSGMLREVRPGYLSFIHNTFKEYLAGLAFADSWAVGLLVEHSSDPGWQYAIAFAAATSRKGFASELISRLLSKLSLYDESDDAGRKLLWYLILRCRSAAIFFDTSLDKKIVDILDSICPPRTVGESEMLASVPDFSLPYLSYDTSWGIREVSACIRTLELIATPEARQLLEDYKKDEREPVTCELARIFDPLTLSPVVRKIEAGGVLHPGIASQISTLANINRIPFLTTLNLRGATALEDLSPLSVADDLRLLYLSGTKVSSLEPISSLRRLSRLDLALTRVKDLSPLAGLSSLVWLNISNSLVESLSYLSFVENLASLNMSGLGGGSLHLGLAREENCGLGLDVRPLRSLEHLAELNAAGCVIQNVEYLVELSGLRSLDLSGTNVRSFNFLKGLKNLEALSLASTEIVDLEPIADLQFLQALDISKTKVKDLTPVAGLKNLRHLDVLFCDNCDPRILGHMPDLKIYVHTDEAAAMPSMNLGDDTPQEGPEDSSVEEN